MLTRLSYIDLKVNMWHNIPCQKGGVPMARSASTFESKQKKQESIPLDDSLALILHEVCSYEIPTKQDIIELCQKMEAGRMAQAALDSAKDEGRELDADQLKELQRPVKRGQAAKESLVTGNLRLVVSIAKKQAANASFMDLMDLIQEGAIGLMEAADKFDYRRNIQFSTYATWWIRHEIGRAIYFTSLAGFY